MDALVTPLLVFLLLAALWTWRKRVKTLPGPFGIPILGYFPFMTTEPYVVLHKLAKKYGPVFSIKLGSRTLIVLDDFQTTKDVFSRDTFMGRPPELPFAFNKTTIETQAFTGLPWKDQRRFSLQVLRELGFGKSRLEDMIKEESLELLKHLEESENQKTILRPALSSTMSNNIVCLMMGQRLPFNHPKRLFLDKILIEGSATSGSVTWQIFFPWISRIFKFFNLGQERRTDQLAEQFHDLMRKEIHEHEVTLEAKNIRDYIDGYLLEIDKRNDPAFCKEVLRDMVGIFFGAGGETVRIAMEWLLLTMAAYPEVQMKVQTEIDDIIGNARQPSWSDQPKMPYTQATINETMRWKTIVPLNLLRCTLWDTELNGYFIPKGSWILSNLWSIHHNAEYWGPDVELYRPERFLEENGKEVKKFEHFMPFSIGKRSCPGENFAKTEIFLFFTSFLQKYNVSVPAGKTADFEGVLGISLAPKLQELLLQKRL